MHSQIILSPDFKFIRFAIVAVLALVLAGCGSTKVYTADKTMLYNGELYNMSKVQRIGTRLEGAVPGDETVDMKNLDKKAVNALFKEHGEIMVSAIIEMDDLEMVYRRQKIDSYSDFSKISNSLDSAIKSINKFMADSKKTQLKLK